MAITVKHTKVSTIPDDADTSLIRPSDWNADHSLVGTVPIINGGTGNSTANDGFNALAPSQTGNSGKYLTTDGSNTSWATNPLGTVTSVALSAPSIFTITGSPIISSGTLALSYSGTALPVANGGSGVTTSSGANSIVLRDSNGNITTNCLFEGYISQAASGTTIVLTAASVQNYSITGSGGQIIRLPDATTLPNGALFTFNNNQSSGAITVQNNSSTTVATINSGGYVTVILTNNSIAAGSWDRHDSTPSNVSWSTNTLDYAGSITSATWNGNTISVNRGGTGQTTANAAFNALAPTQTSNSGKYLTTNGTDTSWATLGNAYSRTSFTATAAQNSFTVSYTVGLIQVYVNGVLLNGADYTATNGTSVVLAVGCNAGDIVEALTFSSFSVASTVSSFSGGTTGLTPNTSTTGNVTLDGTLAVANGGTGVTTSTGTGNVVLSTSPTLVTPVLGTPTSATLTNATGLPLTTGVTGTLPVANGGTGVTAVGTTGNVLTSNGTAWVSSAPGNYYITWQTVKTANFTAVSGSAYPVNTTSGAITVTLPASPSAGNFVQITDYAGTFSTNACTVSPNGSKIGGSTSNSVLTNLRQSIAFVYIDSTQGWIPYSGFNATTTGQTYSASYLVVAGGGSGGNYIGGGGGAGGLISGTQTLTSGNTYTVVVGAGATQPTTAYQAGTQGSSSSLTGATTAIGGGGGACGGTVGGVATTGGSGGGGGSTSANLTGAAGTSGQGFAGGNAPGTTSNVPSAGGGGSAAVGASPATVSATIGGAGGVGTITTLLTTSQATTAVVGQVVSSSVYFSGGGGGAAIGGAIPSAGGSGGGGNGGNYNSSGVYTASSTTAGAVNSGGGGGGGSQSAGSTGGGVGAGGSGCVILSVPTSNYSGTTTGSPSVVINGSNTVIIFKSSGSYTA